MNLPKTFHLQRHDELLAILESCQPSGEMFWLICDFKPEKAFQQFEPLFREASASENMQVFERNYDELMEAGVILLDIEKNVEIKYFTLHIDEDEVTLRYAEPPYQQ